MVNNTDLLLQCCVWFEPFHEGTINCIKVVRWTMLEFAYRTGICCCPVSQHLLITRLLNQRRRNFTLSTQSKPYTLFSHLSTAQVYGELIVGVLDVMFLERQSYGNDGNGWKQISLFTDFCWKKHRTFNSHLQALLTARSVEMRHDS
jgi:hypothetical protein